MYFYLYSCRVGAYNKLRCASRWRAFYHWRKAVYKPIFTRLDYTNYIEINTTDNNHKYYNKVLNPYYVTGFTDGDGSFHISLRKKSGTDNYAVELCFSIGLHIKDKELLELIQAYFGGCGVLSVNKKVATWRVRSIKSLKVVIDHFDNYPLLTKKRIDFFLFKEAFHLITNKYHLTEEGFTKIVSLRSSINLGLSDTLREAFPEHKPWIDELSMQTELKIDPKIIDPYWVAGFTEAEGCFFVIIQENKAKGLQIKIGYQLSQHVRDTLFINSLKEFFLCGRTEPCGKSGISLRVTKIKDITEIIIPFFEKYPIFGSKNKDYQDWKKISQLMLSKAHLTQDGLNQIKQIKSGMNSLRPFLSVD